MAKKKESQIKEVAKEKSVTFTATDVERILVPMMDAVLKAHGMQGKQLVDNLSNKLAIAFRD